DRPGASGSVLPRPSKAGRGSGNAAARNSANRCRSLQGSRHELYSSRTDKGRGVSPVAVKIPLGNIVLIRQVPDKQGGNHKDRFIVLVRDYNDGDPDILGVAITGSFNLPLPNTSVKMPYRKDGNCKTRLNKLCIADCTWRVVATPGDIIKRQGFTP